MTRPRFKRAFLVQGGPQLRNLAAATRWLRAHPCDTVYAVGPGYRTVALRWGDGLRRGRTLAPWQVRWVTGLMANHDPNHPK